MIRINSAMCTTGRMVLCKHEGRVGYYPARLNNNLKWVCWTCNPPSRYLTTGLRARGEMRT
jgi:hypothetical protein